MPLLVAMMRMGARSLSSARLRKEKHSMSNMCTSSMNNTCSVGGGGREKERERERERERHTHRERD